MDDQFSHETLDAVAMIDTDSSMSYATSIKTSTIMTQSIRDSFQTVAEGEAD